MPQEREEPDELAEAAAVGDFVELWRADRKQGQSRSLHEYLQRFPGFERAIAREYLVQVEPSPTPSARLPPDEAAERFGPYRRIRLLGQGGQGEVWLAEDTRLVRSVALKVLSVAAASTPLARVERLRREAKMLARLAHRGICTIYEAELEGPRPYLAMQFIAGETLATVLTAMPGPRHRTEIAPWLQFFREAALALHAAHELGIVHRDIKPGNLMRTPSGAPVLLDFGFAHDLGSTSAALTQSGDMFGTLPYMAPEMLGGRASDHRVDVYALAVTMYETLAGERPFVGVTHAEMRRAIETGDAMRLDQRLSACASDLALVIATAMERDPVRRYATAAAFAEDLRRVHAGEPIVATPISRMIRLRRVLARHPVMATSIGLLAAGLLVALVLLAQLARERARLQTLRQAHLAQQVVAEQPGQALWTVTEAALAGHDPEINDVLYQALAACWEEHAMLFPVGASVGMTSQWIEVTRDDRYLVCGLDTGEVQVVDVVTGKVARSIRHAANGWTTVALGAEDALWTGGADGVVRCFDLATSECRRAWPLHAPAPIGDVAITHIAVAPDRQLVASCGSDGLVAVFDVAGGEPVRCLGHDGGVSFAAFDPAGKRLATLGGNHTRSRPGDKTVRIFDVASGRLLHTIGPYPERMHWLSWSHDGSRIAIAREEESPVEASLDAANVVGMVDLCDASIGKVVATVTNASPVHWVAFAPGDAQIVLASAAGLNVHDVQTLACVASHANFHDRSVFRGEFSDDGTRLAVIAWDDTARIYDTNTWQHERTFQGVLTRSRGLCWNHSGSRLYTVGGAVQSWYATERPFLPVFRSGKGQVASAEFSPDGSRVLAAGADGEARIWDVARGVVHSTLHAAVPLRAARYSPSGEHILLLAQDAPVQLANEHSILRPLGETPAVDGWFLADGRIVLAGRDGAVRVHDAKTGLPLHTIKCHDGPIVRGTLNPQRPWLATGGRDRSFCIVDLDTGRVLNPRWQWPEGLIGERERVFDLVFAPDGQHLYVACEDQHLRRIDLAAGFAVRELFVGPTPGRLVLSPDGAQLFFAAQWSGRVFHCDAPGLTAVHAAAAYHSNLVVAFERQPGGVLALTASKDGTVAVFDLSRNQLISVIHAAPCSLVDAGFSPDGSQIVTADANGDVRIWPVDPLAVALRFRPWHERASLRAR